jgi:hypothetical protein
MPGDEGSARDYECGATRVARRRVIGPASRKGGGEARPSGWGEEEGWAGSVPEVAVRELLRAARSASRSPCG